MNWKNPHPVSDWMKVDPSKLNLKNFNRPSKIEPSASLRKLATLPRTPVTRSQVDKSFRRQSAGIKARNSLPSDLNILPFSNSSSSLLVEDDLNAF
ncbi:hypothetical protein TVAG_120820 [Trichomonas vaginalis G3]|uniref:Uncharacterized protein n=1 Tax=Trichomonas vaginalis (strain ATCC PRA-98 / G3) TaxID=412133 RepID=A2D7M7_TRIV3|nr:hypothetical protein TVAGG3_0993950 [Trichomonas vaginalis G3]EAY23744.1 hypothetical protein TVAG_120820 [Trichomonas vaginalis G3]KAI5490239.1 hypothetical protein TVAGG3_0993950 [Trichomonas vaginalis G3]|eukprot:XP_001276992.1 hypothetical protein [Trichomonas vaginalis G3]